MVLLPALKWLIPVLPNLKQQRHIIIPLTVQIMKQLKQNRKRKFWYLVQARLESDRELNLTIAAFTVHGPFMQRDMKRLL